MRLRSLDGLRGPVHSGGPVARQDRAAVYSGHALTSSVLGLDDNENVREYLVDAKGKQKRTPKLVHQAIRKTLRDTPDQFSVLNGGMVIVAKLPKSMIKSASCISQRPA
jgi:hypothetical protein